MVFTAVLITIGINIVTILLMVYIMCVAIDDAFRDQDK